MRKKNGLNRVLPWMIVAAMIVGIATFSNDYILNASDGDGDTTAAEQQAIAAQEPETVEITLPPAETEAVEVPPASEPAQESVVEPVQEPEPEPVQEPAPEFVQDPAPEPVPEPEQEPVQECVSEPAAEPVPEPEQEPVQECASEPAQEPVREPTAELPESEPAEVISVEEDSGMAEVAEEIPTEVISEFTGSVRVNAGVSAPAAGEEIVLRATVDNANTDAYTLRWEKFNEERSAWESMGRTGDTLYLTATVGGAGSRYRVVLSAGEKDIDTATYTMPVVRAAEMPEADEPEEIGEVTETEEEDEEKDSETVTQAADENTDEEIVTEPRTDEADDNETEPEADEYTDEEAPEKTEIVEGTDGETQKETETDEVPVEEAGTAEEAENLAEEETETPELLPNPDRSVAIVLEAKGAINFGDDVVFRAVLNGYDNLRYTLRWQQCDNGSDWYDLPGEHGEALIVKVSTANANSNWRICVDITEVIGE